MPNKMRTYKRKLILTKEQEARIDRWIGTCRFIYNMCMDIKISAYRNKQEYVHKYELMKQLTTIRDIEWIEDVPRDCLEDAIIRNDKAYRKFFKGSGFPKFASKRYYKSITVKNCITVKENKIYFLKLGFVKMFKDSPIEGVIKTATIIKEPTGYFVCIVCDKVSKSIQNLDESQVIGLDMGIAHFCVDSNGTFIENPRHFRKYERQLRIENRSLERKKKGSNSWRKQCKQLSLLHHKIGNVRKDFLHKLSTQIAKENNIVFIEDLNISGMSRNGNLSKHILDCGWHTFRTMLEYKTTVVAVNPKYTSQACSKCGHIEAGNRVSQSGFICLNCGHTENADVNAAKNIRGRGTAIIRQRKAIA